MESTAWTVSCSSCQMALYTMRCRSTADLPSNMGDTTSMLEQGAREWRVGVQHGTRQTRSVVDSKHRRQDQHTSRGARRRPGPSRSRRSCPAPPKSGQACTRKVRECGTEASVCSSRARATPRVLQARARTWSVRPTTSQRNALSRGAGRAAPHLGCHRLHQRPAHLPRPACRAAASDHAAAVDQARVRVRGGGAVAGRCGRVGAGCHRGAACPRRRVRAA